MSKRVEVYRPETIADHSAYIIVDLVYAGECNSKRLGDDELRRNTKPPFDRMLIRAIRLGHVKGEMRLIRTVWIELGL